MVRKTSEWSCQKSNLPVIFFLYIQVWKITIARLNEPSLEPRGISVKPIIPHNMNVEFKTPKPAIKPTSTTTADLMRKLIIIETPLAVPSGGNA